MASKNPIKSEQVTNDVPATANGSHTSPEQTQNGSDGPTNTTSTVPNAIPAAASQASQSINRIENRMSESELFGQYVVQRLNRQPDDLKRRKLENAIQEAIVKTEKDLF